jgi:hypothetical protein
MKFTAIAIAAIASMAAATPLNASPSKCKPGTYSCTPDKTGWQICDVSGKYVVSTTTTSSLSLLVIAGLT